MKFIIGVALVFLKTNLNFIDTSIFFYLTNVIGYLLIYLSFKDLKLEGSETIYSHLPVIIMIAHSILFSILNGSGLTLKTISTSTVTGYTISILYLLLAVVGLLIIFPIIHKYISITHIKLESLLGIVIILFIISGGIFFLLPFLANISMLLLLCTELLFLTKFTKIISNKERTIIND